jgi:photosystem II stability/assembly factor-like uncharacterized protein
VTGERAYDEEVVLTVDGGASWMDRTPPGLATATAHRAVAQVTALSAEDAWVAYGDVVSGSTLSLVATTDGGRHWEGLGRLPSPYCSLQFVTASVGWCTVSLAAMNVDSVTIYRSTDGGRRWHLESRSPMLRAPGAAGGLPAACDKFVSFSTPSEGWAAAVCAVGMPPLYESTDAGRTWVCRQVGPLPAAYHLSVGLPAVWLSAPVVLGPSGAVGMGVEGGTGRSLVYSSTSGGAAWEAIVPPGPPRPWSVDIVTPRIWKLTAGRTVLTTTNGGESWGAATSDLDFGAREAAVHYETAEDGWYAPVGGTGLYRTADGGKVWERELLPADPG